MRFNGVAVGIEFVDYRQRSRLVGEILHELCHHFRERERKQEGTQNLHPDACSARGEEYPADERTAH